MNKLGLVLITSVWGMTAAASPNVVAWGDNAYGQTNVPLDLTNAIAVAAGAAHTVALRADGTVAAWGDDSFGQSDVPPGLSNVVAVAGGGYHSLALRKDGSVVAWGNDLAGQTDVPPDLTNAVAVAGGEAHSLAVRADGTVIAWGAKPGQHPPGQRYFADLLGQTDIPAGLNSVVAVAAGFAHSLALRTDGTVVAWGMFGAFETWYPMGNPAGLSNAVAIGSGGSHGLALRADGTVATWAGFLPGLIAVPAGLSNVVAVAGGGYYTMALLADGTVIAWGDNTFGQTNVPTGLSNVVAIAAGGVHSVALLGSGPPVLNPLEADRRVAEAAGTASFYAPAAGGWPLSYQWQHNGTNVPGATNAWLVLTGGMPAQEGFYSVTVSNALGTMTTPGALLTVVPALFTEWSKDQVVHLGGTARFEARVQASEPVGYQWRFNGNDLKGETNFVLLLPDVNWPQEGAYSLRVNNRFGAVFSPETRLWPVNVAGWGSNYERPGFPPELFDTGQARPPRGLTNVVAVAAGEAHSLALRADGTVVAWGQNYYGQAEVPLGLSNVVAIAAGDFHNLALRADRTVAAWGNNDRGETNVPVGLSNVVAIAASQSHSVALRADGTVAVWGARTNGSYSETNVVAIAAGESGDLALHADGTVAALDGIVSNVVAVTSGYRHSLVLRADGIVVAWGYNNVGQTNVPAGLSNVVAIAAGDYHSLALRADGGVVAWGLNDFGQTDVPMNVRNVVAIAGGGRHSLAVIGVCADTPKARLFDPSLQQGIFRVSFPTRSGRVYRLEFKDSIDETTWTPLPLVAGDGRVLTMIDPSASNAQRFYRVHEW